MTVRPDQRFLPTHRRRRWGAALLLTAVLGLAGCGTSSTSEEAPAPADTASSVGPSVAPTVVPSAVSTEEVIEGGEGVTSPAEAVLEVDGSPVATGTSRCARAIDETTGEPTVRLLLDSADGEDRAEVVVTDIDDPRVVSAVLTRGEDVAYAGAEGLDDSTLQAERDGDRFSVTGSVRDLVAGSTHELVLRATCQDL